MGDMVGSTSIEEDFVEQIDKEIETNIRKGV